jgi:hypothetical protein
MAQVRSSDWESGSGKVCMVWAAYVIFTSSKKIFVSALTYVPASEKVSNKDRSFQTGSHATRPKNLKTR